VLGRPHVPEEHLFFAAQMALAVKQAPPDPMAPLHVYATREAIYVTLRRRHPSWASMRPNVALEGIEELGGGGGDADEEGLEAQRTIRPSGKEKKVIKKLAQIIGRNMNVVERRAARRELGLPMPDLLKNTAEMETLRGAAGAPGPLIVRDRHP